MTAAPHTKARPEERAAYEAAHPGHGRLRTAGELP